MTAPARFTQSDIKRALKAVSGLGYEEVRVAIDINGRIEVTVRKYAANDDQGQELDWCAASGSLTT